MKITTDVLEHAVLGYQQHRKEVMQQIAELKALLPGGNIELEAQKESAPKRRISMAARKRMAAGQRRRWRLIKAAEKR